RTLTGGCVSSRSSRARRFRRCSRAGSRRSSPRRSRTRNGRQGGKKGAGMKGSMRQRSPGSWELAFDLGTGPDGKRRQKFVTGRGGKREAQAELNRILAELQSGAFGEPAKLTVGAYLEKWLADYAKHNVGGKVFERYTDIVRNQWAPVLGALALSKLQPL